MSNFQHKLKTKYEEQQIEWEIKDFYSKMDALQHTQIECGSGGIFFGETSWTIWLCRYRDSEDFWSLSLICDDYTDEMEVESVLALKKVDGSLDQSLLDHVDEKCDGYCYYSCRNSELLEKKHELTTSDSLTIVCLMKSGTSYYYTRSTFPESPSMKLIGVDTLSDNFKNLFASKGSSDVTLQVKDKAFKAHKAVLMARSSAFSAMFEHDMKETDMGIVNIHDCDTEYFHEFLEYVYCGKLENISFPSVLHLYASSNKYDVQELRSFCVQYMERRLTKDNVCDVIILAEKHDEKKLLSLARRFFFKNAAQIVNTPKWKSLMESKSDLVNKLVIEMGSKMNI